MKLRRITLSSQIVSGEDILALLGRAGEVVGDNRAALVLEENEPLPQLPSGIDIDSTEVMQRSNWVTSCEDLLRPQRCGRFLVTPIRSAHDTFQREPDQLVIIPGMGFGTGHHPTTAQLLELLDHEAISAMVPRVVLDVGTGSGILAIAAAKRFGAQVTAVDIDADAIENAAENARVNACADQIQLSVRDGAQIVAKYDLLIANLYAELLDEMMEQLISRAPLHLFSGITKDNQHRMEQAWRRTGVRLIELRERNGWLAALTATP